MEKIKVVKFTGCKFLDFSDNYAGKKNLISINGETKVCWNRPVIDNTYPSLVQFCKLSGRLNNPKYCLTSENKACSDYEECTHCVKIEHIDVG